MGDVRGLIVPREGDSTKSQSYEQKYTAGYRIDPGGRCPLGNGRGAPTAEGPGGTFPLILSNNFELRRLRHPERYPYSI